MKIKLLALCLLIATGAMAQQKFTLEDLNFGGKNYRKFAIQNKFLTWWGDQLVEQSLDRCYTIDKKTGKQRTLFTLEQVNAALKTEDDNATTFRSLYYAEFPYSNKPVVLLNNGATRMLYNFKRKTVEYREHSKNQQFADWNANSLATAYVANNQLFVSYRGENRQLTTDGSREIVYGQSVHRNEFGIQKGTYWSPDGKRLAFYRMDQSMVADYPQVDIFHRIAQYVPDKYPMAGEKSHVVTVGIYDVETNKTVYLNTGAPTDRYFTNIAWSPDGNTLYMFELNRDQNDCRLVSYNAQTGAKTAELYRETDDKYVEPSHPIVFLPWDSNRFIMQTRRNGYNHLYLCNKSGKIEKQLTQGEWEVLDMLGFDSERKRILYTSNECHPLQSNLFAVEVESGRTQCLDNSRGFHRPSLSTSGRWVVDSYSEPDVPRNIDVASTTGTQRHRLLTAPNPWNGYNVPTYESGSIKANDGKTSLYYRMVKPVNFDPNKKYPTIIYVYGGPHAHNVDATWHYGSRSWETYMAQEGYLLFILDNRGSEHRGKAFEQATFRQLGQVEMQDQMQGVKFLQSLPYVDKDRIGVHGWSFGGFMTISLMTNYPEVFKVGVAGGPVIDWKWYEVMYGERYMDTPQSNPEGYAKTSLLSKAKDLKGKLLVITGYNDNTVVPQHCLSFLAACIQAGTQPDFFAYPGEEHNMRGHQSTHLHEKISQYFFDFLK